MDEEREMVLRMLKEGKITVEEADALLQELRAPGTEEEQGEAAAARPSPASSAGAPPGANIREELRSVFEDIMESFRRDVVPELRRTKEAFGPSFGQVLRGLRGLEEGRAEATAEESMAPGDTLDIRNAWGDVRISASVDGRMRLRGVKRVWAATAEEAQHDAGALPVIVRRQDGVVLVSVSRPEGRRARVDFEIALPAGVAVRVDVAKGDLRVEGSSGGVELRVARGDIQAAGLEGGLHVDVSSGDIAARRVRGDVRVQVKSGDVAIQEAGRVEAHVISGDIAVSSCRDVACDVINGDVALSRVAGTLDVATKSGDVAIAEAHSQDIRVRTLSGDVALDLPELHEGSVQVETVSGDIRLALSPEARATVDASTRSGDVRSALPLTDQVMGFRSLRGVLNGGGAMVRLQATSGDVRIESR